MWREAWKAGREMGPHLFSAARRPEGGYAVTFTFDRWSDGAARQESMSGTMFLLSEKGLTRHVSGCGWTARTIAAAYPDYLIAPPPPPAAPAGTRHTGTAAVDTVIDALVQEDTPKLASLVAFAKVGCGTERWLPPCPEGAIAGTLVNAVAARGCEPMWFGPYADAQAVRTPGGVWASALAELVDGEMRPAPQVIAVAKEPNPAAEAVYWVIYDVSAGNPRPDGGHALGLNAKSLSSTAVATNRGPIRGKVHRLPAPAKVAAAARVRPTPIHNPKSTNPQSPVKRLRSPANPPTARSTRESPQSAALPGLPRRLRLRPRARPSARGRFPC